MLQKVRKAVFVETETGSLRRRKKSGQEQDLAGKKTWLYAPLLVDMDAVLWGLTRSRLHASYRIVKLEIGEVYFDVGRIGIFHL
jgi:hypothetical protein